LFEHALDVVRPGRRPDFFEVIRPKTFRVSGNELVDDFDFSIQCAGWEAMWCIVHASYMTKPWVVVGMIAEHSSLPGARTIWRRRKVERAFDSP